MMKWDRKYELGHDRIDGEHKIFFDLIIDFKESSARDESRPKLMRILNELGKYAEFHFVSEENLMIDCAYPQREVHARQHAHILSELNDISWRFRSRQVEAPAVFDMLFQWFAPHTSSEDKKIAEFLQPS